MHEAEEGFSDRDFQYKLYTALKEARETEYWLELLYRTEYISQMQFESINNDCIEILRILVSIIKTLNLKKTDEENQADADKKSLDDQSEESPDDPKF